MNRMKLVLASISLALVGLVNVSAHEHEGGKMGENMGMKMPGHHCGPMAGMHPGGMHSNMVATSDGGVVVMCGNHLVKFDKNLKQVKDVEMECACCAKKDSSGAMDDEAMCPRHSSEGMKSMEEKKVAPKTSEEKKPAPEMKPADPVKK